MSEFREAANVLINIVNGHDLDDQTEYQLHVAIGALLDLDDEVDA